MGARPPVSDGGRVELGSRVSLIRIAGDVPAPGCGGFGPIRPDVNLSTLGARVSIGHGDMLEPHTFGGTADAADRERSVSDGEAAVVYGAGLKLHRVLWVAGWLPVRCRYISSCRLGR